MEYSPIYRLMPESLIVIKSRYKMTDIMNKQLNTVLQKLCELFAGINHIA